MAESRHVAYLTVGEDLNNPLLRRQVVALLIEIKRQRPDLSITLFAFLAVHTIINHLNGIRQVCGILQSSGIRLRIVPSLVPWPIPHCRLKKVDLGYRPYHVWNHLAARMLGFATWPVIAYYYVFRRVRVYHCRSYPPAYVVALFKKLFRRAKLLFDPRSDFPEENVTAGNWREQDEDFLFWKRSERMLLQDADAVACIAPSYASTYRGIFPGVKTFLVPNNVDCATFRMNREVRASLRAELGIGDGELVFCYLGAMTSGGWNRAEVYAAVAEVLLQADPSFKILFIIPAYSSRLIRDLLRPEARDRVIIVNPPYAEVSGYLAAADYGLMFMHKRTIRVGTKSGEYLASGLPVLTNRNCLGLADLVEENDLGMIVKMGLGDCDDTFDSTPLRNLKRGAELQRWSGRVAQFAESYFDNRVIASGYCEQYDRLLQDCPRV